MLHWRRTLYTIWITEFIAILGFAFFSPFLPYYIQQLGVTDIKEAAMWAGLSSTALAVGLAIMAPIWGALADRYSRKMMVLRATFAGAILVALMSIVGNIQQLILLRFLQGVFTGTVTAAITLVAAVAPREEAGAAVGSLQTAIYLGTLLGPLLGGITADTLGYQASFWITAVVLFLSGLLVILYVQDSPATGEARTQAAPRLNLGDMPRLLAASGSTLLALFAARLLMRAGPQIATPSLPLFVQTLLPEGARVATVTGIVSGANAVGAAIGAPFIGRLGDRTGHRPLLIASGVACVLFWVPQALVRDAWALTALQLLTGAAVGGTLSTLTAMLLQFSPKGCEGMMLGLDASITGVGNAVGPMAGASAAAGIGLPAPFVLSGGVMGLGTLVVWLWVKENRRTDMPGS